MASRLSLLFVLLASAGAAVQGQVWGGASSVVAYANALTAEKPSIGSYASVGSTGGVANFFSGNFAAATSDDPMSVANDSLATTKFGGKITFPIALTTYSFVTRKAKGLQITGAQMAGIYSGKIKKWSQIKKGLRGPIVPVCRDSGSGTTEIITKWLNQYDNSIPVTQDVLTLVLKSKNSRLITATGSAGMAASTKNKNAIAYTQTGVGLTASYGNFEVALQNTAGAFVLASNADPLQSIPRSLPAPTSSWAAVSLVNANGQGTYPLASFEFTFVRSSYNGAFPGKVPIIKSFFKYALSAKGQLMGKAAFFTPIPAKVNYGSVRALRKIKA